MTAGGINPPQTNPDSAANYDSLSEWAGASRTDWLSSWIGQITGTATQFLNFPQAISDISGAADIDFGELLMDAFTEIPKGIFVTGQAVLDIIVDAFGGSGEGNDLDVLFDFLTNIPGLNIIGELLPGVIPGLDASSIISGSFPMDMIDGLLDFLEGIGESIGIGPIVEALTGIVDGDLPDLSDWAGGLLTPDSPLDAFNLFNIIPSNLLGLIGVGQIGQTSPNLLSNGGFDTSISMQGGVTWTHDPVLGRTSPGCASITVNGTEQRLMSNAIPVAEGDKLSHIIFAQWAGLAYTGTPFRTRMVRLFNHGIVGVDNLAAPTLPAGATNATWSALTAADYTVPAGCDEVCYELYLSPTATAGTIKFDDAEVRKTGLLQMDWTQDLPEQLGDLFQFGQDTLDSIFEGITGFGQIGTLLSDIKTALGNIPFLNVTGTGGPATIGGSIQETWDQWVGGLVGAVGSGAGLSDLFNLGQQISSWSSLGRQSWDILGIRNNKPMATGMLATSSSNISLDKVAFTSAANPSAGGGVTITQSTARRVYKRVEEYSPIGVVSWTGSGTTNITHFFVNIYSMNTDTGDETLVHESANIIADVGSGLSTNVYSLPVAINPEPGQVYAYEFAIRGTGTHTMAGDVSWLPSRTDMYPRRWAAVRNSGTSAAPPTIAAGATTYAGETPFVEIAITTGGVSIPRTPELRLFNTAGSGSIPVPSWANFVDVVLLGGGGGGRQGGTWGISGEGGDAGVWAKGTAVRGTHFSGTISLTYTVGAGGPGGGGNGVNGGTSSATLGIATLTAAGGEGGDALNAGGGDMAGKSPGNESYNGQPYVGGGQQGSFGAPGAAPGGGGAGGNYVSFQNGGNGATGAVWVRFRQS